MLSVAQRAAYRALLDRALSNEDISEETAQGILSADLFVRFVGLMVGHDNRIADHYHDEVWKNWRSDPPSIKRYKDYLAASKQAFRAAPKKLEALLARKDSNKAKPTFDVLFNRHVAILSHGKTACWQQYDKLSGTDKLWTKPDSATDGWPPELVDEPPLRVMLPDAETPGAFAIRHLLTPLLEER
jgi:hypothetical protein